MPIHELEARRRARAPHWQPTKAPDQLVAVFARHRDVADGRLVARTNGRDREPRRRRGVPYREATLDRNATSAIRCSASSSTTGTRQDFVSIFRPIGRGHPFSVSPSHFVGCAPEGGRRSTPAVPRTVVSCY